MSKLASLTAFAAIAFIASASADTKPADPVAATFKDIEAHVGFVPAFMRTIPRTMLPSWWEMSKAVEMNPNSALDPKTKELIGLAVAAQIPCDYCIVYHTEAARAAGANDAQIQEAVSMAALTRLNSTLGNGLQADKVQFRKDLDRLMKGPKK